MTTATENIIRSACAMDATVDAALVGPALAILTGNGSREQIDEPLTPGEVAQLLKCTTRTVARYEELGKIRAMTSRRNGMQTRYSKRSVMAFMEGRAA